MDLLDTKNPEVVYVLKRGEEVIGIATILPLKPGSKKFEKVLMADTSILLGDVDISADDIEEYTSGNKVQLYLAEIGIKPSLHKGPGSEYGAKFISHFMDAIVDMKKSGAPITQAYREAY